MGFSLRGQNFAVARMFLGEGDQKEKVFEEVRCCMMLRETWNVRGGLNYMSLHFFVRNVRVKCFGYRGRVPCFYMIFQTHRICVA